MSRTVVWAIRPRPNSFLRFELRPHVEESDGWSWREMSCAIMATSKESAYALLPVGYVLLLVSGEAEWWAPWWAPDWWWPNGSKPASMWSSPPVRARPPSFAW